MEGLNRDLDGTEKWLPLESLGIFEKRILGKLGFTSRAQIAAWVSRQDPS